MKKLLKNNPFRIFICFIVVFIILIVLYGKTLGNKGLLLKEYEILNSNYSDSYKDTKIAHFADILYDSEDDMEFFDLLLERINSKEVDIIIFSGGLIDKNYKLDEKEAEKIIEKLSKLDSKYGKYYVTGKYDKDNQSYDNILSSSGFTSLNNTYDIIYNYNKDKICVMGIGTNYNKKSLDTSIDACKDTFKVIAFHESNTIKKIKNKDFDLAISSNSLNGQINIPGIKNLLVDEDSDEYYNDYYKINGKDFYVSSGIGTKLFDYRLFNKPSYNIYVLKK